MGTGPGPQLPALHAHHRLQVTQDPEDRAGDPSPYGMKVMAHRAPQRDVPSPCERQWRHEVRPCGLRLGCTWTPAPSTAQNVNIRVQFSPGKSSWAPPSGEALFQTAGLPRGGQATFGKAQWAPGAGRGCRESCTQH